MEFNLLYLEDNKTFKSTVIGSLLIPGGGFSFLQRFIKIVFITSKVLESYGK